MITLNPHTARYFIWILFAILLTACLPLPGNEDLGSWVYTDLIALDDAGSAHPSIDILAIYTRADDQEIQIRLDLLDHKPVPNFDTYLAIDNISGGTTVLPLDTAADIEWDYLVIIPASGEISARNADGESQVNTGLRVQRDPTLDTIQISMNRSALEPAFTAPWAEPNFQMQVYLTEPGSLSPVDQIGPVSSHSPPPAPVPVVIAFWNAFPAYTPSQALRRWDGAHTGPNGSRHGLHNLLRTAQSHNLPLVLLDVAYTNSLSTLDYFGGLDLIRSMQESGLLLVPTPLLDPDYSPIAIPEGITNNFISEQNNISAEFDIPPSSFLYAPSGHPAHLTAPAIIFTRMPAGESTNHQFHVPMMRSGQHTLIPIPGNPSGNPQATQGGLSLDARRSLIAVARMQASKNRYAGSHVAVLGGNLPGSTWGIPDMARESFRYINAHPWIKVLNAQDLQSIQPIPPSRNPPSSASINHARLLESAPIPDGELLHALLEMPQNQISAAAWHTFYNLFNPVYPPSSDLPALRTNYLPHLWSLIESAHWADTPYQISDCSSDYDRDGNMECMLASNSFLFLIDPDGGGISFGFWRSGAGVHQLIGPSSQFISGSSDPMFWDLAAGIAADPSVLPGAFIEPGTRYRAENSLDGIRLFLPDSALSKSYQLSETGLCVQYHANPPASTEPLQIPLALDPWTRFISGWSHDYHQNSSSRSYAWQHPSGLGVRITASGSLSAKTFLDSYKYFIAMEDPNRDYPVGHFVPFPMSIVEANSQDDLVVCIEPYYSQD